jgi:membrane protease YdiL (CAAX protease family)
MLTYLRRLVAQTFYQAESDSIQVTGNSRSPDLKLLFICTYTALGLTFIHYFMDVSFTLGFLKSVRATDLASRFETGMYRSGHAQLWRLAWWAFLIISVYAVIPMLVTCYVFQEKLSNYGLKFRGAFKDIRLYFAMLGVMIPLVLYFSTTKSFQARYPFYDLKPGEPLFPDFIIWELLYFLQFFSLEFFFRGFMLHGMKNRFGFYSVFIMTIPYCMIHFGKPFPETLAAIIAGVVLGILSLKSRSIWLGVLIHYSVALTMDLCALWHKTR